VTKEGIQKSREKKHQGNMNRGMKLTSIKTELQLQMKLMLKAHKYPQNFGSSF